MIKPSALALDPLSDSISQGVLFQCLTSPVETPAQTGNYHQMKLCLVER
ncbi:MAG: hypothetical protein JXA42_08750 [Anaerolineales bacterium]|nr:hypothetical protein [Anaerolineales bacterium]